MRRRLVRDGVPSAADESFDSVAARVSVRDGGSGAEGEVGVAVLVPGRRCRSAHTSGSLSAEITVEMRGRLEGVRDSITRIRLRMRLAQGLAIVRRESRGRPGFRLEDEYDLQRFLHALLVLHFADVRPEESTPSWAGGFYRIDFLLKRERVAVEAKMASSSLGAKKIRDQLVADIFGYRHHPEAAGLFAVIYDPARRIDNPRGFEEGMSSASPDFPVRVVVAGG
ncbi:PD-(D/E)XK nuclease domain-containing protein [Streptomyces lydicus]|uniref:PD-(D/E)XK nuclease domain-containing protein n=1 Tax=Streptomyces lydicus TaxID=47763 RepID=UPI003795E350